MKHWSCSGFLCLVGVDSMTGSNITSSNCGVYITCQILESHQLISCVYHVFSNAWFFTISTKNGVYTVALDRYVKKCVYPGCPGCHADVIGRYDIGGPTISGFGQLPPQGNCIAKSFPLHFTAILEKWHFGKINSRAFEMAGVNPRLLREALKPRLGHISGRTSMRKS